MDTQILKHGVPARLFPVLPDSCKEQKSISIVLATMMSVRPFAEKVLGNLGVRVGKTSKISCFTEVTLTNEVKNLKDRPDALIVVETGKRSWSALVEAKVGRNNVETDQLERYIELAKANSVDERWGTYHYTGNPFVSWAEFAREIFRQGTQRSMIAKNPVVNAISTEQYPMPAKRPHNSRLDCSKITKVFGIEPDDWQASLGEMLDEIKRDSVT